jgi:hypothetical protein
VNDAIPNPARLPTARQWARLFVCAVMDRNYRCSTQAQYRLRMGQLMDSAARADAAGSWAAPRVRVLPTWQGPNR